MKTVEVKNNVENKEAMNTITSVERLEQLVKGYAQDFPDTFGSNDDFLDGCKEILKWADKGSYFRCTVFELGYYGAKGQNHVSITFRGSKYSTFGPKDLFTVKIYEEKIMFFSTYGTYRRCTFDVYGKGEMTGAFVSNLFGFIEEFASKKEDMERIKIFTDGEAESFFPGYLVDEIEDHDGEITVVLVTSTEDSPEADRFREFTKGGNIYVDVLDGVVYISCDGDVDSFQQTYLFRMNFEWDGTEKHFKEQLDICLKKLGYKMQTEKNNVQNRNSKVNVPLKDGEFVAWMIDGDPDMTPFRTKKECVEFRNGAWAGLYKSVAEMDRLIPAVRYVFAGKFGMEGNVPVCSVEERIKKLGMNSKNEID